jgi:hypothetical protein
MAMFQMLQSRTWAFWAPDTRLSCRRMIEEWPFRTLQPAARGHLAGQ